MHYRYVHGYAGRKVMKPPLPWMIEGLDFLLEPSSFA